MTTLSIEIQCRLGSFTLDAQFEARGSVIALFGPSGAGKSTLLRIIAGVRRPDNGRIVIAGQVVFDSNKGVDLPAWRRSVGFVFQDGLLFPHLRVRQNLLYGRWVKRVSPAPAEFERIIEVLGIGHLLDRWPRSLSGGERQRVAIGRALLSNPKMLLMDEPITAVDLERRAEILPFLRALTKDPGVPILYVSHAIAEVQQLAEQVVYIREGRVVAVR